MTTRYAADPRRARRLARRRAARPRYRVDQVVDALYRQRDPARGRVRRCPRALRAELAEAFPLALDPVVESTRRRRRDRRSGCWQSRLDGAQIETVLMRYPDRATVCVSSPGRLRDGLHVLRDRPGRLRPPPRRRARSSSRSCAPRTRRRSRSPTSCSWAWASRSRTTTRPGPRSTRLHDDLGLSARHITVSTVGVVPGIRRLADRGAAGHARGLAARAGRRAAQHDDPDQPPLPARRGDRRGRASSAPRTAGGSRSSTRASRA